MDARAQRPQSGQRWWLHGLLFLLTALTTTIVGSRLALNFEGNRPAFIIDEDFSFLLSIWESPELLLAGLPFSLTLLTILLAHELGQFLGVPVSPDRCISPILFAGADTHRHLRSVHPNSGADLLAARTL